MCSWQNAKAPSHYPFALFYVSLIVFILNPLNSHRRVNLVFHNWGLPRDLHLASEKRGRIQKVRVRHFLPMLAGSLLSILWCALVAAGQHPEDKKDTKIKQMKESALDKIPQTLQKQQDW